MCGFVFLCSLSVCLCVVHHHAIATRNQPTTNDDDAAKAVDLYVFERALAATHGAVAAELTAEALRAYTACSRGGGAAVLHRLAQVCHGVSWCVMVCVHRCVMVCHGLWFEVRIERQEHTRQEHTPRERNE